jgi:chromosome segregation ATPase
MAMLYSPWSIGFLLLLLSGASAEGVTPIQKVLQLLGDMLAKSQAEKADEEIKYSAYQQWCTGSTRVKRKEIADADKSIELLKAEIQKAIADIEGLTARVQELGEDIGRWKKDTTSATTIREKETADFKATNLDYDESIDAIERAINVLKKQEADKPQAAEFVQSLLQLRLVPRSTKSALNAFLQQAQDPAATYSAPEANAYEFQSGGVIDMLQKLKTQFKKEKTSLEEEEMNKQHGYEGMLQKLNDEIENAEAEIKRRSKISAERQQDQADAEKTLTQTTSDREEDQTYLDDLSALCMAKARDYEKRQAVRADEIKTIQEAMEILGSSAVSGAAEKHLPALVQLRKKASSLVQLRAKRDSPLQRQVAQLLAGRAQESGSQLLALVAQKVAEDPFKKVKKMIKDLVIKLMEEATAETEHKGWCDTELTTNKQTRDSKASDVASLSATIDQLTAELAQLAQDISDLQTQLKELDQQMAKATADRAASKEKNTMTIQEAKDAQEAISQALAMIKDFYAKNAENTALVQQSPSDDQPESWNTPYKGKQAQGGGVIDFLEVIMSDFARLEAETTTDEESEQEEYDKFMFDSKKDTALKEQEISQKQEKTTAQESALQAAKRELSATQEELDAAMAYYDKLKPQCVDSGITYEERVKRREEEIQSLKDALQILSGESI